MENNISEDSGATLTDGIRSLQTNGICQEIDWPYDINKYSEQPPLNCYIEALKHKALQVRNITNDLTIMKTALASGYPFVVGIYIFESFESNDVASTGLVPMPDLSNEQCLGGHAVVCCGYDDPKKQWIMRNSWGESWGDKGYFYLPYTYLLDSSLSSDLWNIISVIKT
jgi:C1A family cysteine protease